MNSQSLLGLFAFPLFAWLISENRRDVRLKTVFVGIAAQLVLGALLLKISIFRDLFLWLNKAVITLETSTRAGTSFVFGYLGGGALPFDEKFPGASFVLALQGLPLILVVSALSAVLFYWGVLPLIVRGFAFVLGKLMDIGGAAGLGAAANIFVGMIESPLLVKPYLRKMTRSELFLVMTCGMATIAGNMMVLYASILTPIIPASMGHILTASLISAPAAIMIAKLIVPETMGSTSASLASTQTYGSTMDAITKGTTDGIALLINIIAMLIVLVALVSLVNSIFGLLPYVAGEVLTLQRVLGWIMAPLVWFMGVPWSEAVTAGSMMGVKTVLNEFLAYLQMAQLPKGTLSYRTELIMTYAMCGFANFGSLGIMIGGIGSMVPERRDEIINLGLKSIVAGTLATMMTGCIAGLFG
ncbi:MAG TPA: nucleoside transporter C-terminal domain-containing protein [Nitrospinota bacterium]|nr:nucleoside transporter C-terminal domain-containing protein [Nitrospinota bacterium]|tara:strand:+ start:152202 stop:153443 length:1242 start_codon:yes stop_codon:yes gene_type:complete